MRAPSLSLRTLATAAGLVLPLATLPAQADPRAWVDPPAKSAGQTEAAPKGAPAAPASTGAEAAKVEKPAASGPASSAPAANPRPTLAAEGSTRSQRTRAARKAERAERIAGRRHPAPERRLAETPAAHTAAPAPVYAPAARVEAAQSLAMDYLSVVSAPGEAMVGATPRFYGSRVRFYGRATSLADLVDEKRGFVRRWPERRYAARGFNTRCTADGSTCVVRVLVDFRAASPERGAVSKGASELVLEVSFAGQRPVIVAESGRVLHRGSDRAETLAQGAGRG